MLPARSLFALAQPTWPGRRTRPSRGPGDPDRTTPPRCSTSSAARTPLARDCGPVTYDEATVRRWLVRPGRYADIDRYAYLVAGRLPRSTAGSTATTRSSSSGWPRPRPQATRALWGLVASHSSVADTVRAQVGPADPFWWLLREQDADIADRESWMLRLLDAPAAIAARGFPATDLAVPLHITDDLRPANSGRGS